MLLQSVVFCSCLADCLIGPWTSWFENSVSCQEEVNIPTEEDSEDNSQADWSVTSNLNECKRPFSIFSFSGWPVPLIVISFLPVIVLLSIGLSCICRNKSEEKSNMQKFSLHVRGLRIIKLVNIWIRVDSLNFLSFCLLTLAILTTVC